MTKNDHQDIRLQELAHKWLQGTLTEEERVEFDEWFNSHSNDTSYLPVDRSREEERKLILKRIYKDARIKKRSTGVLKYSLQAAAAILLISLAGWLFVRRDVAEAPPLAGHALQIDPGASKATLRYEGNKVSLNNGQEGIIVNKAGITYADGSLLASAAESAERTYSIETPRGGQYRVTLPDSSIVWINSASILSYPSGFKGSDRIVSLEKGEAYFEIEPNKKPFIVRTDGQELTVLGTSFNISNYKDENEIRTTLVSGSVRIRALNGSGIAPVLLEPNQQAVLLGGQLTTHKQDVRREISWKDGVFDFTGKNTTQIMRQLERWYDLKIVYEGRVPEMTFWGRISRKSELGKVLKILQSAQVKFRVEPGRKLVILGTDEQKGG